MDKRIEHLLSGMTLEEKVSMAADTEAWHSTAVERLGVGRKHQAYRSPNIPGARSVSLSAIARIPAISGVSHGPRSPL